MNPQNENNLERLVHKALQDLPARRAPTSLESRVQAEIARRAALPWWRKSFVHWPIAARAVFVVVCAGLAKVALMGAVWVFAGVKAAELKVGFATELRWLHTASNLFSSAAETAHTFIAAIPPLWLYGGVAAVAALYALLFGVGAAAYRTFNANS